MTMPARNGRDWPASAEPEDRAGWRDREVTKSQQAGDEGVGVGGGGGEDGDEKADPASNAHDFVISLALTLTTVGMFLGFTMTMSGWLPWRAYLMRAGALYVVGIGGGFMLGLWLTAAVRDWSQPAMVGFACRATLLLIAFGFLSHATMEAAREPDELWWTLPLLWAPAILLPAIGLGAVIDGALLGAIASGLPRRTPWHALRFVVCEYRRLISERHRP
ncbi:MAG: hypothetical protein OXQ84_10795 [bacterium]|nr:hypothetical protein [bacterium]